MNKKELTLSEALNILFPLEISSIKIESYKHGYNDCVDFVRQTKEKLVEEHNEKKLR